MTARGPILVVDDDDDLRQVLGIVLAAHGYEVIEAEDGIDALAKMRGGVEPSLILLDLRMPRMNGTEFLQALRADPVRRHVPVVVVSGDVSAPHDAEVVGAAAFLRKPVELEVLLDAIDRHATHPVGAGS